MDKFDLDIEGKDKLTVLEYQGNKGKIIKRQFNNVYVKNFSKDPSFDEKSLEELFKPFGEISSSIIMRDGNGVSKGFGFICFTDPSAAEKATSFVLRNEINADGDKAQESAQEHKVIKGVKLADLYVREAKKKEQRHHEL